MIKKFKHEGVTTGDYELEGLIMGNFTIKNSCDKKANLSV